MEALLQRFIAVVVSFLMALSSIVGLPSAKKIENVILMIGDGMGETHLDMTESMRDVSLVINTMPQQGYAMTWSANNKTTDSAAGATALACGVKTANGMIGMYWEYDGTVENPEGSHPKNITELCMENGMKTGVVTTAKLSGATPGGFTAHTDSRDNDYDILSQQIHSGIDIIWGKADSTITEEEVTAAGYVYVNRLNELNALTGNEKSYGMFTSSLYHTYNKNSYTPTLSQMTEKAIDLLSGTSENGFFLMVEGAHIDKKSHDEDEEGAAEALEEFDNAVEVALDFAKNDGHTLVIVTADHETGGVTLQEDGTYLMTTGSHTSVNVPVRAYCKEYYVFIEDGEIINNIEISVRIAEALGFAEGSIPAVVVR